MEILLGLAVLLVLLFVITGDWGIVVITVVGIAALLMIVFFGFFVFFLICLLRSQKKTGHFLRFDKTEKKKFETAIYEVDGAEYPDAFPAEPIFRRFIYRAGVPVKLRFSEKRGEVYDRNTIITVIVGNIAFALSSAVVLTALSGLL